MAAITRIDARIVTGNLSGAGTDGGVFVAVAGREFHLDSAVDDFERNSDRTYTLGQGPNINNSSYNNPQSPQLDTDDLDRFPVWVRFEPYGSGPNWNLRQAVVTINPGQGEIRFEAQEGNNGLWLGQDFGKFCFLKRVNLK